MQASDFKRQFFRLILLTWMLPPVVGLGFILFVGILSPEQMLGILLTPWEPLYILIWLGFVLWYFPRYMQPVYHWLLDSASESVETVLLRMRQFPLRFWLMFLIYLILAPSSVILSAEYATDFIARPVDWFRIHLVALIVSIIVGLPIFFLILDLFGRAIGSVQLTRPHVTIKTKVFLIGALVPLLIDTMLVQYFWTRTGFFSFETFVVWLFLELLAIAGSLIFMRSFGQSLAPLQNLIQQTEQASSIQPQQLAPRSTDELGVLATGYKQLLNELNVHNEILRLSNRLLRSAGDTSKLPDILDTIVRICGEAIGLDRVFLILKDDETDELVGVTQTDALYNPQGYFRLSLDEVSTAVWIYKEQKTIAIDDLETDPRVSKRMRQKFNLKSALGTPLICEDQVIGVLLTASKESHHFTPREIAMFENLSREASLAINTSRLSERRKEAERARAEREEHISLLLESTAEAIYGVDLDSICTFVNPSLLKMLGYRDEDQLVGKNIHELIHHTHKDGTAYAHEECRIRLASLSGKTAHVDDEVFWKADGSSIPVEYWSHPIRRNGEIIGTVVTFVDISERLAAESERKRHHQELEQRVAERTAELTALNEELKSFSYSISHDLRAPLRTISGFTQALVEDYGEQFDETAMDYFNRVVGASNRMGELIEALLKLSRITRSDLHFNRVDLSKLVEEISEELNIQQSDHPVEMQIEKNLFVRGDVSLLKVALENLLGNAWKYTSRVEKPRVKFGSRMLDGETVFFVEDNGAGFSMEYATDLFIPFKRLHTQEEFSGTGIGLATVQRIIQRHGGRIWAEAEPNQGAKFNFTFGV